jgi:hypothetical protein
MVGVVREYQKKNTHQFFAGGENVPKTGYLSGRRECGNISQAGQPIRSGPGRKSFAQ